MANINKPNEFSYIILSKSRSVLLIKNVTGLRTDPVKTHLKFNYFIPYSVSCTFKWKNIYGYQSNGPPLEVIINNRHLLSAYCVQGTVLGMGLQRQRRNCPCSHRAYNLVRLTGHIRKETRTIHGSIQY